METATTIAAMRAATDAARRDGRAIALVPTMGYFHDGHLGLIHRAREIARPDGLVVVSNFVNPTQFGPGEDLERYPRDLARDESLAAEAGADVMFVPSAAEIYPDGYATTVSVGRLGETLCGADRPGHFDGVATVVLKLFQIVRPATAVFGWKDAQQLVVVRRMAADLHTDVAVEGLETVREADGLAMSSRNVFLTPDERAAAPMLRRELLKARDAVAERGATPAKAVAALREALSAAPLGRLQYAEAVRLSDLQPLDRHEAGDSMIALAYRFSAARLIDNIRF